MRRVSMLALYRRLKVRMAASISLNCNAKIAVKSLLHASKIEVSDNVSDKQRFFPINLPITLSALLKGCAKTPCNIHSSKSFVVIRCI